MDLTTEEGMQAYLREKHYPNCTVQRLPEGSGGFVYRVRTNNTTSTEPRDQHPATVIVKHVQPYAARAPQWKLDQTRMQYERKGLQFLSSSAISDQGIKGIRAPQVFHFDAEAWVLIIEDAGDCPSVKGWLTPVVDPVAAAALGVSMGTFLAAVHDASAGRDALLRDFDGNATAKLISGTLYYGGLPRAAKAFGYEAGYIDAAAAQGEKDVMHASEVLTIGDFWTGNVLVAERDDGGGRELFVVDLELCKPGTPDFDVGQMAAELYCVAAFRRRSVGLAILDAFLKAYRRARKGGLDVGKVAVRIAAHLFVIMPNAWANEASQEQIAEQLKVADELLRLGAENDAERLKDSIVGPLIS